MQHTTCWCRVPATAVSLCILSLILLSSAYFSIACLYVALFRVNTEDLNTVCRDG